MRLFSSSCRCRWWILGKHCWASHSCCWQTRCWRQTSGRRFLTMAQTIVVRITVAQIAITQKLAVPPVWLLFARRWLFMPLNTMNNWYFDRAFVWQKRRYYNIALSSAESHTFIIDLIETNWVYFVKLWLVVQNKIFALRFILHPFMLCLKIRGNCAKLPLSYSCVICADNDQLLVLNSLAIFFHTAHFWLMMCRVNSPKASLYGRQCIDSAIMPWWSSATVTVRCKTGVSQMQFAIWMPKPSSNLLLF